MRNRLAILTLLLLLPGFMPGSPEVSAQVRMATLVCTDTVDVCDIDSKWVALQVNVGSVAAQDQIYGYHIELRFDNSKLRFTNVLSLGTLAGQISNYEPYIRVLEPGLLASGAASIQYPLVGNKPMVAFLVDYLGKGVCPDTSWIKIEYFEAPDAFVDWNPVDSFPIIMRAAVKPQRNVLTTVDNATIQFATKDTSTSVLLTTGYSAPVKFSQLNYRMQFNGNLSVRVDSVTSTNTEKFEVVELIKLQEGEYVVRTNVKSHIGDRSAGLNVHVSPLANKTDMTTMTVQVFSDSCNCASAMIGPSVKLYQQFKDTTVIPSSISEADDKSGFVCFVTGSELVVRSESNIESNIEVFNVLGRKVASAIIVNHEARISTHNVESGVLFVRIQPKVGSGFMPKFIKVIN